MTVYSKYFTYFPAKFPGYYLSLYNELDGKCVRYVEYNRFKDAEQFTNKKSCYFIMKGKKQKPKSGSQIFSYGDLDEYFFEDCPTLLEIKQLVETLTNKKYDYCLAHIYVDGKSSIGKHRDKEALLTDVCSVSFMEDSSQTRRFKIYKDSTGEEEVFDLGDGDVFWMHGRVELEDGGYIHSFQEKYIHEVPKTQKKGMRKRINLTFRQFQ